MALAKTKNLHDYVIQAYYSTQAVKRALRLLLYYQYWQLLVLAETKTTPYTLELHQSINKPANQGLASFQFSDNANYSSVPGSVRRLIAGRFKGAPPPPFNMTLTKGSVHIAATRAFIHYITHDMRALQFLNWTKLTFIPDETFFSSLNHNPQLSVPGAYLGVPESYVNNYLFITRYKNWVSGMPHYPCGGKYVRWVCIMGVGYLPALASRPELFVNKFNADFEPLAYDCLEELMHNRTREELNGGGDFLSVGGGFNLTFYASLPFVKNHV